MNDSSIAPSSALSVRLRVVKRLLSLSVVPVEGSRDTVDPVLTPAVEREYRGEGVAGG